MRDPCTSTSWLVWVLALEDGAGYAPQRRVDRYLHSKVYCPLGWVSAPARGMSRGNVRPSRWVGSACTGLTHRRGRHGVGGWSPLAAFLFQDRERNLRRVQELGAVSTVEDL